MRKNEILEILSDWNFWKKELETGISRNGYIERLGDLLSTGRIVAVIGVRRAGKSFIMRQYARRLMESGVRPADILIVNLEDPRFFEPSAALLNSIYETYIEFLKPQKKPYIFLDEVQNADQWERWVRTFHELNKAHIIISGSSSKLLGGELATVLTGRHLDLFVFPLSFMEFLKFRNVEIKSALDFVNEKAKLNGLLREYMEFGGFPEVVLKQEKRAMLTSYFDDIVTKDIVKRFNIRKVEKLLALARFYLTTPSSPITFTSLKKFLNLTTDTIEKFSSYLEAVNLIFFIRRFSFSVKEQEKSARKVYSIDPGLSNAIGFRFSENLGRLAENIVAIELRRKQTSDRNVEIYYWKDQQHREVDFVIKVRNEIKQLIQVCWDVSELKTKQREIRSLLAAMEKFKLNEGLVITEDYSGEEIIRNKKIIYKPLLNFLLGF